MGQLEARPLPVKLASSVVIFGLGDVATQMLLEGTPLTAIDVHASLATLPAERHVPSLESVHGVGPVTAAKLRAAGVSTVATLAALGPDEADQVATAQRLPLATLRKVVVNARTRTSAG